MKRILLAAAAGLFFCAVLHLPSTPKSRSRSSCPFAAGGPTDKVARDLADVLRKSIANQSVIIDNVGGAGGTLGAAKVARAAPTATRCCCTTSACRRRRRCIAR